MLPTGHIEFTWATLNFVQRRTGLFQDADYRLMAVAALVPDLLDKPLALTVYRDTQAALFWGHNLWLHGAVWLAAWGMVWGCNWVRRRSQRRLPREICFLDLLPYLLAFSGHLFADRMWGFRESLLYPFGAGYWHPWMHVGEPAAMVSAYLVIIRATPILILFEAAGSMLLAWFIWDRRLWELRRLGHFLRTGRPGDSPASTVPGSA